MQVKFDVLRNTEPGVQSAKYILFKTCNIIPTIINNCIVLTGVYCWQNLITRMLSNDRKQQVEAGQPGVVGENLMVLSKCSNAFIINPLL